MHHNNESCNIYSYICPKSKPYKALTYLPPVVWADYRF